ncbi:MAG TPA: hypothetical protein VHA55_00030 [Pseudorhodoplanes sp.]|nr:hypothetical protein [Pseudorhodoplanes sp.]
MAFAGARLAKRIGDIAKIHISQGFFERFAHLHARVRRLQTPTISRSLSVFDGEFPASPCGGKNFEKDRLGARSRPANRSKTSESAESDSRPRAARSRVDGKVGYPPNAVSGRFPSLTGPERVSKNDNV